MRQDEFEALAGAMRPRLHRYCARMMGSAFDGEDVVQDALAKAMAALPGAGEIERPEAWLLRIAHNAALDALRRRRRRGGADEAVDPERLADKSATADARVAAAASLAAFMPLSASERSCVVLVDVLGDSLAETAQVLGVSLAAVKAALHRGRARLRAVAVAVGPEPSPMVSPEEKQRLRHYVDRFNARDFDALRDLLAQDVKLDLVNRRRLEGKADVAVYFHRYDERPGWRFSLVTAEGRPALLGVEPGEPPRRWLVRLEWRGGEIGAIQDFFYADYIAEAVALAPLEGA